MFTKSRFVRTAYVYLVKWSEVNTLFEEGKTWQVSYERINLRSSILVIFVGSFLTQHTGLQVKISKLLFFHSKHLFPSLLHV